jgi:23S rRNA maturation mini-RNase III
VEEPTAKGAHVTKLITLQQNPNELHKSQAEYTRRKGNAAQINTKRDTQVNTYLSSGR